MNRIKKLNSLIVYIDLIAQLAYLWGVNHDDVYNKTLAKEKNKAFKIINDLIQNENNKY